MTEAIGVTIFDGSLGLLVPLEFVAVTVKVYDCPLVRPVTVCVRAVVPALPSVPPEGLDMTV